MCRGLTSLASRMKSTIAVLDNIVPKFARHGLGMAGCVRADNAMMSMIFTRDMSLVSDLERRFQSWLAGHRRDCGAA